MKVVLIGFMGSGKSRVGRLLASRLEWPHYDTDEMIAKHVGMPAGEIIRQKGEATFRDVERKAVMLVSVHDRCVISTGGGVPLDSFSMGELAKNAFVVWLRVAPETVLQRVGNLGTRPLIDPKNPLESVRARMQDREPLYAKVAHATIDSDGLTVESAVDKIQALLTARPS